METLIILGVLLGLAGGLAAAWWYFKSNTNQGPQVQSTVLLNKIRHVCKLITVEGEFLEVFAHRD